MNKSANARRWGLNQRVASILALAAVFNGTVVMGAPHGATSEPAAAAAVGGVARGSSVAGAAAAVAPKAGESAQGPSADEVLTMLRLGNERFIDGAVAAPRRDEDRRRGTAGGQHPVAGILSCSDSRVPVEVIFDQGIGDLFVVRVAGNVAGNSELASLGYGVEHLNLPLIVVMGHSKCGAVKAAVDGANPPGPLGKLVAQITPSVQLVAAQNLPANARLAATVRANVRYTMAQLQKDPVIAEAIESGKTRLIGAVYDISSGVVQWVDPLPIPTAAADAELVTPEATAVAELRPQAKTPTAEPPIAETAKPAKEVAAPSRLNRPPLPSSEPEYKPAPRATTAEPHSSAEPAEPAANGQTAHATDAKNTGEAQPTTKPAGALGIKRDNWIVLGSMLAAASGLSVGVIQWIGSRKENA